MLSCREVDALVRIAEIAMAGLVMAALLVSASPGEAQQAKRLPQVDLLTYGSPLPAAFPEGAVVAGLKELGWVEGQNMTLLIRYAEGRPERLPDLARDLVGSKVDIIVSRDRRRPARQECRRPDSVCRGRERGPGGDRTRLES